VAFGIDGGHRSGLIQGLNRFGQHFPEPLGSFGLGLQPGRLFRGQLSAGQGADLGGLGQDLGQVGQGRRHGASFKGKL
jgi:hypothetical protein